MMMLLLLLLLLSSSFLLLPCHTHHRQVDCCICSIFLSTYIIIPIKAQNKSTMLCWWRLYIQPWFTTCRGTSNPSFPSHQLIVTYFCIGNHSIFSFQSLNWPKSRKVITINGVPKEPAHSAGKHWPYWFVNPPFPSHQQNVTQLMQRASLFSLSTTGIFPKKRIPPYPWCFYGVNVPGRGGARP